MSTLKESRRKRSDLSRYLFRNLTYSIFQIADLVELNGLHTRIGKRKCFAGDGSTHLELVLIVRRRPEVSSAAPLACISTPCYILTAMKPLLCFLTLLMSSVSLKTSTDSDDFGELLTKAAQKDEIGRAFFLAYTRSSPC